MSNLTLSPYPQKSKLIDKENMPNRDWLGWFDNVYKFCSRLLNRYDTAKSGFATLVAGTVTIANTNVTTTVGIRLTPQNNSGIPGHLFVTLSAGVGFTITSSSVLDTRRILYEIVEGF